MYNLLQIRILLVFMMLLTGCGAFFSPPISELVQTKQGKFQLIFDGDKSKIKKACLGSALYGEFSHQSRFDNFQDIYKVRSNKAILNRNYSEDYIILSVEYRDKIILSVIYTLELGLNTNNSYWSDYNNTEKHCTEDISDFVVCEPANDSKNSCRLYFIKKDDER